MGINSGEEAMSICEMMLGEDETIYRLNKAFSGETDSQRIIRLCSEVWEVPRAEILSRNQTNRVMRPRHAAMMLVREMIKPQKSLTQIARMFNRDHTTVLNGIRCAKRRLPNDALFRMRINEVRRRFSAGE